MDSPPSVIPDRRAHQTLRDCARLTVKTVARMRGPAADELFEIAADGRKDWNMSDWRQVLAALDSCEDTVGAWLAIRL